MASFFLDHAVVMLCIFGFMYVCMFVCLSVVLLLHIDLFSFSWLQVCLNKFSSVQFKGEKLASTPLHSLTTAPSADEDVLRPLDSTRT